jgi:preprotein translocase subunit SecD
VLRKLGLGIVIAATLLGTPGFAAEDLVLRVDRAEAARDQVSGGAALHVWLDPEARKAFASFTLEHVGHRTDLVVDGDVLSSPVIQTVVDTEMLVLSGVDSFEQAQEMAEMLSQKKATMLVRLSAPQ